MESSNNGGSMAWKKKKSPAPKRPKVNAKKKQDVDSSATPQPADDPPLEVTAVVVEEATATDQPPVEEATAAPPVVVAKLRHWKQRFDPAAAFIWRRDIQYGSESFKVGELIPQDLLDNKYKLRLFWEGKLIELAIFDAPPMHRASASA